MEPDKEQKGFNIIEEGQINTPNRDRLLQRQSISQWSQIAGGNKNIIIYCFHMYNYKY